MTRIKVNTFALQIMQVCEHFQEFLSSNCQTAEVFP